MAPQPTRLRAHVGLLCLAVAVIWPLLDLDGVFISDEGSYAVQARALDRGSWDMGYPFSAADPEVRFDAFHGSAVAGESIYPYPDHPLWPVALTASSRVLGEEMGLRALGVASLVASAAAAWGIGRALGGLPAAPLAFWVAAVSPVLANAWIVWAHAASAAAGGLLVLALLRSRSSPRWLVVAGAASAVSVLLRSEGLLWVAAVGLAVVLLGRDAAALRRAGVVLGAGAAALLVEMRWVDHIVGRSIDGELAGRGGAVGTLDRLRGLRTILIDGGFVSSAVKALGLVLLVVTALAAWSLRQRGMDARARWLLVGAAGLVLLRCVADVQDPTPGLLVAAPSLLLALAWRPTEPAIRWVAVSLVLFVGALALTVYPDGGSLQWGGRFLSPAVPLLAALAAVGVAAAPLRARRVGKGAPARGLAAVAVLLGVQAAATIVVPNEVRQLSEAPVERVAAAGPPVLIANGRQIARLDWRGWPDRCWVAVPTEGDAPALRDLLAVLARSGIREATYAGWDAAELRAVGARVERRLEGLDAGVVQIPSAAAVSDISPPYRCRP